VVVVAAMHAERSSRMRGRRPKRLPAGAAEPAPIAITRVTVIAADPFSEPEDARSWLDGCRAREGTGAEEIADALVLINRAVAAYRVAAADPHAREVTHVHAVQVRLGYGSGPELVDGLWQDAYLVPAGHGRPRVRRRMLAPEEEIAGILSGRRPSPRASEELLLRARLDLEQGRLVEAALQVRAAAEAMRAELDEADRGSLARPLDAATRLAAAGLEGRLDERLAGELGDLVAGLERAARKRRYATGS
jgi:hypothetical protein